MKRAAAFSKQITTKPKLKYLLCGLGVMLVMSVLAAIPPLSQDSIVGTKPAAAAKKTKDTSLKFSAGQTYFQTASTTGQANSSVVQGPVPQDVAGDIQNQASASDVAASIISPWPPQCAKHTAYPMFSGCDRLICPDTPSGCSRCGGPGQYGCLIEE